MRVPPPVIYVDVDGTLVRSEGTKTVPIPATVAMVRRLAELGVELYCWSTGGSDYALRMVEGLGLTACFKAFLPKPKLMIDDVAFERWVVQLHPIESAGLSAEEVLARAIAPRL